jgi:hypothetical protein
VPPGELAEVDFGRLGKMFDPESGRKPCVWTTTALLVTLGIAWLFPNAARRAKFSSKELIFGSMKSKM